MHLKIIHECFLQINQVGKIENPQKQIVISYILPVTQRNISVTELIMGFIVSTTGGTSDMPFSWQRLHISKSDALQMHNISVQTPAPFLS